MQALTCTSSSIVVLKNIKQKWLEKPNKKQAINLELQKYLYGHRSIMAYTNLVYNMVHNTYNKVHNVYLICIEVDNITDKQKSAPKVG